MLKKIVCVGILGMIFVSSADAGLFKASAPTLKITSTVASFSPKDQASLQILLALSYLHGRFFEKDIQKGKALLEDVASSGDPRAQNALGELYLRGRGVRKDWALAKAFLEKSSAQQNPKAFFNLGIMHDRGWGVSQSHQTALTYYQKAARLLCKPAIRVLKMDAKKGDEAAAKICRDLNIPLQKAPFHSRQKG